MKLRVHTIYHKCIDTDGYWDGTYDESFEYIIYDDEGLEIDREGGFHTAEKARLSGEKRLKKLEERL